MRTPECGDLPAALEIIPPITIKDRLAQVDDYVLSQQTTTEDFMSAGEKYSESNDG